MSNTNMIDLHMHSIVSADGQYEPSTLMNMCHKAGLSLVALADHNSLQGIKEAEKTATSLGMNFVKAIELDCVYESTNIHLLGYGIEDKFGWFRNNELSIHDEELKAGNIMIDAIENLGINVDRTLIKNKARNGVITGELIAEVALFDKSNNNNPLLKPYRKGGNRSDNPYVNFYWDFCSQKKAAYAKITFPSFEEAMQAIINVGGIPVLAHPGANLGQNIEILSQMQKQGLQGVEVYSSYHNKETMHYYSSAADKLGLFKTIGSDFHGKTKPAINLGVIDMPEIDKEKTMKIISGLIK